MAFCTKCGFQLPESVSFCPSCGAQLAAISPAAPAEDATQLLSEQPAYQPPVQEQPAYQPPVYSQPVYQPPVQEQPAYQPPVYSQPIYQQPVYHQATHEAQPTVASGDKVKGFVGMGLGIGALVFAVVSLIMSFGALAVMGSRGAAAYGGSFMVYAILTIGLAIPGKILSAKAAESGFTATPTKLGSIFSLIGIIMGGIAFFLAILCIAV